MKKNSWGLYLLLLCVRIFSRCNDVVASQRVISEADKEGNAVNVINFAPVDQDCQV